MTGILSAVLVLGALGLVFGILLAIASRVFAVETDERVELITELLPGANCGGCGFAGCSACAVAISEGTASVTACPGAGQASYDKIAEIMGVAASATEKQIALVRCDGGCRAENKFEYIGLNDCLAAMKVGGDGPKQCPSGCLGMGTCVRACRFGALSISENGVAVVDLDKCTGCGTCVPACPKKLIVRIPESSPVSVKCISKDAGAQVRQYCEVGCIACKLCEKACGYGAVRVADNIASIDYSKCVSCGACVQKCPRHIIEDVRKPGASAAGAL